MAAALIAVLVVGAGVGIAAVVLSQSFTATPATRASPVAFAAGDDAARLADLGFLDAPVVSASGAAASLVPYGIPGAAGLALGEVLELRNPDSADDAAYLVTMSVSGTPAASLTGFVITFYDDVAGTPTLRTWDLLATPSLTGYTLSDGETWELSIGSLLMSAVASGAQGSLTITASITPV